MTRVLSVIPSPYVSGLQEVAFDYFGRLVGRLHSHFLLTRWSDGECARRLGRLGLDYTYSWIGFFSRRLDPATLRMSAECMARLPALYRDTVRLLRAFRPQLVYLAGRHELMLLWPILRAYGAPVVFHMHDPAPAQPFYQAVARYYDRAVTRYIAVSRSVGERTVRLGVRREKIELLYNGVDLARFPAPAGRDGRFAAAYGWPDDSVIVGMTGQMIPHKGHHDFLDAAEQLAAAHPQARFVIGGKNRGAHYEDLRARVERAGLAERVRFSGWQADVGDFFRAIDIFALPSRHEEGFGLVVAEAMACGLPTVVADSGGAAEVPAHGESGLVVERGRPDQLAQALGLLLGSAGLRAAMGARGRRRVEERFRIEPQVERFAAILEGLARR